MVQPLGDEARAQALVNTRLALRHTSLTHDKWIPGYCHMMDHEVSDDEVTIQIAIIHDDLYERTYNVNGSALIEVKGPDEDGNSSGPQTSPTGGVTQFYQIDDGLDEDARKQVIRERLAARPFLGGCSEGKARLRAQGAEGFDRVRVLFWDTTEACWAAGEVLGMWKDKPRSHWLLLFDDGTDYGLDPQQSVWQLDYGHSLIENSDAKVHVTVSTASGKDRETLQFVLETESEPSELSVHVWRHGVRVWHTEGMHRASARCSWSDAGAPSCEDVRRGGQHGVPLDAWDFQSLRPLLVDEAVLAAGPGILRISAPVDYEAERRLEAEITAMMDGDESTVV